MKVWLLVKYVILFFSNIHHARFRRFGYGRFIQPKFGKWWLVSSSHVLLRFWTKVKIMVKRSCIQPSYISSNEFYKLYRVIVGHPKTRFEDVLDSLASDYKEIVAVSVASNKGIANLTRKKENNTIICSDWNT